MKKTWKKSSHQAWYENNPKEKKNDAKNARPIDEFDPLN